MRYLISDKGCWEWQGSKNKFGYGYLTINNKKVFAHRVAYQLLKGLPGSESVVMHTCDNRLCINPDHLALGTQADNIADMRAKNRHAHKLSQDDVLAIKAAIGSASNTALGRLYGVTPQTISAIKYGKIWNDVRAHNHSGNSSVQGSI